MFLDMKDSTTVAEKLGHVSYFELLSRYYDAMSDPIINSLGEVYQYIGDEVVVSWTLENGLKDANCLNCYFGLKEALQYHFDSFRHEYGVVPDFRAGMHLGEVTTGEIGALKKEIVFTGDVLNTTARLQSLAKEYQTDLMLSGELVDLLPKEGFPEFKKLGSHFLRGKKDETLLFTLGD